MILQGVGHPTSCLGVRLIYQPLFQVIFDGRRRGEKFARSIGGGGVRPPPTPPPPPLGDAELLSKTLGHGEERAAARHAHSAGGMQAMAALHTRVHEPQGEDWGWAGGTLTYLSQNQPHDVHHGVGAGGGGGVPKIVRLGRKVTARRWPRAKRGSTCTGRDCAGFLIETGPMVLPRKVSRYGPFESSGVSCGCPRKLGWVGSWPSPKVRARPHTCYSSFASGFKITRAHHSWFRLSEFLTHPPTHHPSPTHPPAHITSRNSLAASPYTGLQILGWDCRRLRIRWSERTAQVAWAGRVTAH